MHVILAEWSPHVVGTAVMQLYWPSRSGDRVIELPTSDDIIHYQLLPGANPTGLPNAGKAIGSDTGSSECCWVFVAKKCNRSICLIPPLQCLRGHFERVKGRFHVCHIHRGDPSPRDDERKPLTPN
jgi:hypothetical protein